MLSLLIDENISPVIAEEIKRKRPDIDVTSMVGWQEGRFLGLADEIILMAAAEMNVTLVTYDLRTISSLLGEWGQQGKSHGGVIFIDDQSIPSNNFGVLVGSLIWLWDQNKQFNWQNRLVFLQPTG